jgi:feruloyl esterase
VNMFSPSNGTAKPSKLPGQYIKHISIGGLFVLFLSASAFSQSNAPAVSCESLAKLVLPDTIVTMAQPVAAGEFKTPSQGGPGGPGGQGGPPGDRGGAAGQGGRGERGGGPPAGTAQPSPPNPAFCRVSATMKPSSDSDIKIEVWLPLSGWNGKFMAAGSGGWGGSISYRGMLPALQNGYATAATDTGHDNSQPGQNGGAFLLGHPEKAIDYGYRADHEMTVKAKAIIKAFYGTGPKHSYWVGCSLGGLEALIEAKRYPEDYDGIVAGAPLNPITRFNAGQIWAAWLADKHPDEIIPVSKFSMIHEAALKACASPTALKQGFIDDPENCRFDPGVLLCKGEDAPDCLTAPQLNMMRRLYAGPVNPRTKESIFPGIPVGGEVAEFPTNGGTRPAGVAVDLYKYWVYQDPDWDWKTMDFDTAIDKADRDVDPLIRVDSNLNPFLNHGGKLMIYVGGSEPYAGGTQMSDYYKAVLKNAGAGKENSVRLFQVPGMNHCGGGAGCDTFEKLGIIDEWAVTGKAPDQIIGSKVTGGKVIRTRPICAYPAVAKYKGSGSEDEAENFVCTKPQKSQ